MIELIDISKTYGNGAGTAVNGLNLAIADAEFLVLIGQSGSGKTTTLNMINRLIEPSGGAIRIDGEDALAADPVGLRRRMGYVFQGAGLFPHLSVAENVAVTPRLLAGRAPRSRRGSTNCSIWFACRRATIAGACRANFPAGSSSALRSPARWRRGRRSC
ncbi:MAG: ATP-binding cassette domain-containing protein [Rhizomicrobium sp.]